MGQENDDPKVVTKGNQLFQEVVQLSGLPSGTICLELERLLEQNGSNPHQMTLDDLRNAALCYLNEITSFDVSH